MNELFAPGQPLAEPMQYMLMNLRDASRSNLILGIADDFKIRHAVVAELFKQRSDRWAFYEFDYLHAERLSLGLFCWTLPRDKPACIIAHGLEELAEKDKEKYEAALFYLNMHREDTYYTKTSVVLWVAIRTYDDLWRKAPDFTDWIHAFVNFNPEGWKPRPKPRPKPSPEEVEHLHRQARRYEEMLHRSNLAPALVEEFRKQLAKIRGQIEYATEAKQNLERNLLPVVTASQVGI
jgi:hypothetical protein